MKLKLTTLVIAAMFILSIPSYSQTEVIPISTKNIGLALKVDGEKNIRIIYLNKKLSNESEYNLASENNRFHHEGGSVSTNAFAVAGGDNNFVEPAAAVVHADGNNSLILKYDSHEVEKTKDGATITKVTMKDPVYPFYVDLFYKAWYDSDVIEQWSVFRHNEKGTVALNKYASANLYLFNKDYYLTSYNGTWAKEMQPVTTKLQQGMHTIQTRLGTRENLHTSPNFMVSMDGEATEKEGVVLLGQIAWNGNYIVEFETDVYRNLHIVAGINPYQSQYYLQPNTPLETPRFIYTLSFEGKGQASRNMHNWMRNHNLLDGMGERLTLLNNWEATYFDFDQDKLVNLFSGAKDMGVDMFLLDDGWFANKYPRNSDTAGLGDWEPNKNKLPDGVPYLVENAEANGLKFGIWIEAEMINPKSELYEKHKDWVLRQENRPEIYFRSQLVLDLTNPEVQDFVFGVVDKLFTENPTLAYIKWDCNAPIFNAHSKFLEKKKIPQSHLYVEYTKGFEKVLQRVRAKYPLVPMMLCSGGGGRSDYNSLKYFTEFWLSDNTDPLERIFMQWDYSYYYPAIAMSSHVTDWSNRSLKYRTDVASMGKLGFDIRADELSDRDMEFCKNALTNYDKYKHIIWHGEMYRLASPYENDFASFMFTSSDKTKAVMFSYLTNWRYVAEPSIRPIKLDGLNPDKKYKIEEVNLYSNQKSPVDSSKIYSGDFLMKSGFNPSISSSRSSVVLYMEEI